jgi:hypothetical protein
VYCEFDSVFGNCVNLRVASVPYAIDYPGTVSDRPSECTLPLGDLVVSLDEASGRLTLCSSRVGLPVRPVYTASMWERLLPPAARLLMDGFAESPVHIPPNSWWLNASVEGPPNGIERHPRIELGEVVVRRAFWAARADEVPRRRPDESEAHYLLRFTAWLRDNGLPDRSFVRVYGDEGHRLLKDRKPMFLDAANWFLVMAFERRLARDAGLAFFTEELPRIGEGAGREPIRARVIEYVFEIASEDPGE